MTLGQVMGRNVKHKMKYGKWPAPCSEPLGALGAFGACSPQNLNFLLNTPVDPSTADRWQIMWETLLFSFVLPPRSEEEMMGANRVLEPRFCMLFSVAKVKNV